MKKDFDESEINLNNIEETILSFTGKKRMVPRKKIVRRNPSDTSPKKNYFDETTQDAIVRFQKESSIPIKNLIYEKEISPAFNTLVENLINVYKFQVTQEDKTELRKEVVHFLFTVLQKFDADKGSKAFSYFNVVAMNKLTILSKQSSKNNQTFVSIDNREALNLHEQEMIEMPPENLFTPEEYRENILKILTELKTRTKNVNETVCIEAIFTLIENIEKVEIVNKRAVLAYLRDITGFKPKQLSVYMSQLKKNYKLVRKEGLFFL